MTKFGIIHTLNKKNIAFFFSLFLFYGLIFTNLVLAEPQLTIQKNNDRQKKIFISANRVELDSKKEKAVYTGNVTVRLENTTLLADRIEVYSLEGGRKIEVIEVYGNIKILYQDKTITAQKGIYYHQEKKLVLTGDPRVSQENNYLIGDKITYYYDQQKAFLEGNVEAIFPINENENTDDR